MSSNLKVTPAPTGEGDTSLRVMLAEAELKVCNPNLEIVFLRFASHDDVEGLIRVFGATLNTVGHVLLVLVRIQPHTEGPDISMQLRLRFRTYNRAAMKS